MKFVKKSLEVEAKQLLKGNENELIQWAHAGLPPETNSILFRNIYGLLVWTIEGYLQASYGDWIIRGIQGEFYPCKPEIFKISYDPVDRKNNQ